MSNQEYKQELQEDIYRLQEWAKTWLLTLNMEKCKILHIGRSNPAHSFYMKDGRDITEIVRTKREKDLGVNIDEDLKFSEHIEIQVNKANKLLGLIRRSFTHLDKESMLILYKSLIRPLLEYGHSVTFPRFEKDKKLLERVQRRATKLIPELKDKEYEERLRILKLPSLQYRRERGDMIECYKYTHNLYKSQPPFQLNTGTITRGHAYKIKKVFARLECRKHFFGLRAVNNWNSLPESIVTSQSLDTFKNRLDRHWNYKQYALEPCHTTTASISTQPEEEIIVQA